MISRPSRLDKSRQLLYKQLKDNITRQAHQIVKRPLPNTNNDPEYNQLQIKKKKHHTDQAHIIGIVYGDQKKFIQKQYHSNDSLSRNQINAVNKIELNEKQNRINEKITITNNHLKYQNDSKNMMRQILDDKILNIGYENLYDSEILSQKQKFLVSIQQKLDEYLTFIKQYRKKRKGQFFGTIRKHFLQNNAIFLEFSHIKKINYICPKYYSISPSGNGVDIGCIVSIWTEDIDKQDNKTTESIINLKQRKQNFRKRIQQYVLKNKTQQNKSTFQIPEVYYDFQKQLNQNKINLKQQVKQLFNGQLIRKKIDKFFVLEQKNSLIYKKSKNLLKKGIQKVQNLAKKQNQINLTILSNKMFVKKVLTVQQINKMIQEISFLYNQRSVVNMQKTILLQNLSKAIVISQQIIPKVIDIFIQKSQIINQNKPFLKQIIHKNIVLLQYHKNSMKQFSQKITTNQQFMKEFSFDSELNQKEKQKILEDQRQKILKQAEQQKQQKQKYSNILKQAKQNKKLKQIEKAEQEEEKRKFAQRLKRIQDLKRIEARKKAFQDSDSEQQPYRNDSNIDYKKIKAKTSHSNQKQKNIQPVRIQENLNILQREPDNKEQFRNTLQIQSQKSPNQQNDSQEEKIYQESESHHESELGEKIENFQPKVPKRKPRQKKEKKPTDNQDQALTRKKVQKVKKVRLVKQTW